MTNKATPAGKRKSSSSSRRNSISPPPTISTASHNSSLQSKAKGRRHSMSPPTSTPPSPKHIHHATAADAAPKLEDSEKLQEANIELSSMVVPKPPEVETDAAEVVREFEVLKEQDKETLLEVWNYIEQVASGLAHIHANGILHMDIKPDNILVGSDGVLKIGDFNQATKQNQLDWEEGDGGYVAPELLRDEEPGPETDMYSFGAMVYEWATGENFPRSCLDRALIQIPTCRSKDLRSLVHALLNPLRHERPTATDVLKWRDPREESNP